jgi:hypothetical protein
MATKLITAISEQLKCDFLPYLCVELGLDLANVEKTWEKYICNESDTLVKANPKSVDSKSVAKSNKSVSKSVEKVLKTPVKSTDSLEDKTLEVLRQICRDRNEKVSGTKQQVIDRLNGNEMAKCVKKQSPKKITEPKKRSGKDKVPVLENIEPDEIKIGKDQFGNLVHDETGIVFKQDDGDDYFAIGFVNELGDVDSLTCDKMEICKQYGFKYIVPENVD